MKVVRLELEAEVSVGAMGEYVLEHMRRGIPVLISPSEEYIEAANKGYPKHIARVKHLDLGAVKKL